MYRGRFIYSIGANSGANMDTRTSQNVTAHLGFKVGGMRLDGENATGATGNPLKPWEETALTVDLFGTRSASHFANAADATMVQDDLTYVLGGHLRGTVGSFELDSGLFQEWHNHATDTGIGVKALAQYDELSYVVFPWLVPAVRMEYVSLLPDGGIAPQRRPVHRGRRLPHQAEPQSDAHRPHRARERSSSHGRRLEPWFGRLREPRRRERSRSSKRFRSGSRMPFRPL